MGVQVGGGAISWLVNAFPQRALEDNDEWPPPWWHNDDDHDNNGGHDCDSDRSSSAATIDHNTEDKDVGGSNNKDKDLTVNGQQRWRRCHQKRWMMRNHMGNGERGEGGEGGGGGGGNKIGGGLQQCFRRRRW